MDGPLSVAASHLGNVAASPVAKGGNARFAACSGALVVRCFEFLTDPSLGTLESVTLSPLSIMHTRVFEKFCTEGLHADPDAASADFGAGHGSSACRLNPPISWPPSLDLRALESELT